MAEQNGIVGPPAGVTESVGVEKPNTSGVRSIVSKKTKNTVCFLDRYLLQKVTATSQIVKTNKVPNTSLQTWLKLYKCLQM